MDKPVRCSGTTCGEACPVRVDLEADDMAAEPLGDGYSGAKATERIEDPVACRSETLDDNLRQLLWEAEIAGARVLDAIQCAVDIQPGLHLPSPSLALPSPCPRACSRSPRIPSIHTCQR